MYAYAPLQSRRRGRNLAAKVGLAVRDPSSLDNWDADFIAATLPYASRIRDGYYHGTTLGLENVPDGPFIMVGVHGGGPMNVFADNLVLFSCFHERFKLERRLYAVAHHIVFKLGPIGVALAKYGAIDGNPRAALRVLEAGHGFIVYPGGEEDMARTYWDRNRVDFHDHTGFVSVALKTGVPVLPVGEVGGHETEVVLNSGRRIADALRLHKLVGLKTFPIALTVPWGLTVGYLPYLPWPARIRFKIGKPITFSPAPGQRRDRHYKAFLRDMVEGEVQRLVDELRRDT